MLPLSHALLHPHAFVCNVIMNSNPKELGGSLGLGFYQIYEQRSCVEKLLTWPWDCKPTYLSLFLSVAILRPDSLSIWSLLSQNGLPLNHLTQCVCVCVCARAFMCVQLLQSCPTLCDPNDCSLQGSSVYGIFQARLLEWVAMLSSRGSSRPGIEPASPVLPALQVNSLPTGPPRKPT